MRSCRANGLVRMRGGGVSDGAADLRPMRAVGGVYGSPFRPPCPRRRPRIGLRASPARPGRELQRGAGAAATAAAAAAAGAEVARAGAGGRCLQPPSGQRPQRAHVAARAPAPPVVLWDQPLAT